MKFSDVQEGDIVHISQKIEVSDVHDHGFYSSVRYFSAHAGWELELVERPDKNWPPQVGDIWEADGNDYIVETYPYGPGVITVVAVKPVNCFTANRTTYSDSEDSIGRKIYSKTLEDFKALKPVMAWRREIK